MFFYEAERFGENDELFIRYPENLTFPVHLHRCFEFIYIYEGEVTVTIDEEYKTLCSGEMLLIFPNQLHSYNTKAQSRSLICIFAPEYINMFYQLCKDKKQEILVTKLSSCTTDFILQKLPNSNNNKFIIKSCIYAICSEIMEQTNLIDKKVSKDMQLQHNILSYIENNFSNDITLNSLSKTLGYDYHYISRYIKVQFKTPFMTLLNERRIFYSAYLIKNTEKSITEIALSCGYKTIRSFNRNFLQVINKTPSEYRKCFF